MFVTLLLSVPLPAPAPAPFLLDNSGPTCVAGADIVVLRQGDQTTLQLDGSASFDPEGDPLTFIWTTGCPGAVLSDANAPAPTLTLDTPAGETTSCSVRLRISDGQYDSFCRLYVTVNPDALVLSLDVKPGSCPNPINAKKGCKSGVVTVALVGDGQFDPADVDLASLELVRADGLGSAAFPYSAKVDDVATPFTGDLCGCHCLKGDGADDLKLKFKSSEIVKAFQLDKEKNKTEVRVTLRGSLLDGTSFSASDCVVALTKNK